MNSGLRHETHDSSDWEDWVSEHAAALLLFARQQSRSEADAQDLVQEAVVESWSRSHRRPPPLSLVYWTIRRRAIDWARGEQRRANREASLEPETATAWFDSAVEERERTRLLQEAMSTLPEIYRDVITLKIWGGLTFAEIAQTLGIPANTAASRYRYGLAELRLLSDRQALENGYVQQVDGGKRGRFHLDTNPVQFDETPPTLTRGPEWGEHTDEVLKSELGLPMEELLEYKAKGVICSRRGGRAQPLRGDSPTSSVRPRRGLQRARLRRPRAARLYGSRPRAPPDLRSPRRDPRPRRQVARARWTTGLLHETLRPGSGSALVRSGGRGVARRSIALARRRLQEVIR